MQEQNQQKALDVSAPAAQGTEVAIINRSPAERAVIALDSTKTEIRLRELVGQSSGIVEVIDPAGRDQAHRMGMNLKNARVEITNKGKAAREDAQAFSKAVIAGEKYLIEITEPEEKRIMGLRDAFDEKMAREAREAAEKEAARVAEIRSRMATIADLPRTLAGATSAIIHAKLVDLAKIDPDSEGAGFAEFAKEARDMIDTVAAALKALRDGVKEREDAEVKRQEEQEAERKRIAAETEANRIAAEKLAEERAELERQRAANAEAEHIRRLRDEVTTNATVIINDMREQAFNTQGTARQLHHFLHHATVFKINPADYGHMSGMVEIGLQLAIDTLEARIKQETDKEMHDNLVDAITYNAVLDAEKAQAEEIAAMPAEEEPQQMLITGFAFGELAPEPEALEPEPDAINALRAAVRGALAIRNSDDVMIVVLDEIMAMEQFDTEKG